MIGTVQRKKLVQDILWKLIRKGRIPSVKQILLAVSDKLAGRPTGIPLFTPKLVGPTTIVDPKTLRGNLEDVVWDLETLNDGLADTELAAKKTDVAMALKIGSLQSRLNSSRAKISSKLLSALNLGVQIISDDMKTASYVDSSRTTAFVDYANGQATLPPSTVVSGLHLMQEAQIIAEETTVKPATSFAITYDMSGKSWYIDLKDQGTYTAVINLTGKAVVMGHSNEIQANSIEIETLTGLDIGFDISTDGMNWVPVVPSINVSGRMRFNFEPTWALYLRVKISGSGVVGIRNLFVHKLTYSESAIFQTKLIQPTTAYSSLSFEPTVKLPTGTSIEHYLVNNADPDGPGIRIEAGMVNLHHNVQSTTTPPASDFSLDSIPNLYTYNFTVDYSPIIETAQLFRGYQQWKVEAVDFVWRDTVHTPQISEWDTMLGEKQSAYMSLSPIVGTGATWLSSGVTAASGTIISNYGGTDTWTVFNMSSGSTLMVQPTYNYRFTTKVYMDRDIIIENGAAGLIGYAPISLDPVECLGWAIYINGNRVAADNFLYYMSSVPGSGSLSTSQGKNFQIALIQGWNTIEVLIDVPSTFLPASYYSTTIGLFIRPDLFTLQLPNSSIATGDAPMTSYPLWAESEPLRRVSEFYLKAITSPWYHEDWAFRLNSKGEPIELLLNYNPMASKTIDGKLKGSDQSLYLKYFINYGDQPGFYYRSILRRTPTIEATPSLMGYKFSTTRT